MVIAQWCRIPPIFAFSFKDVLVTHSSVYGSRKKKKVLNAIFQVVIWSIWRMRNEVIFGSVEPSITKVVEESKSMAYHWVKNRSRSHSWTWSEWQKFNLDCVVLGADTRATAGSIVADKNCEKIHNMAPNILCCGAGTAADTEAVTDNISSQLKLHRYHTGRESRVVTALTLLKSHLFRYQGHVSAALVLGGVDVTGPHLHTVS
ncbi:putative proteasome endopeptidase complex [Helianthus annuus]|nr:putative proteasome endopeptidase complex [Helianthus annuus]